jgi:archaemetzincin
MHIGILPIGDVEAEVLVSVKEGLRKVFPKTHTTVIEQPLPVPRASFDRKRGQYRSNLILAELQSYVANSGFNRVLGVCDVDLFVPELNFVFGEATFPGKTALISLSRLKPEFYGEPPNVALLVERAVKEAVHEVGHTLGLKHCPHASCVMHFSNSLADTDKKQKLFCEEDYMQAAIAINSIE